MSFDDREKRVVWFDDDIRDVELEPPEEERRRRHHVNFEMKKPCVTCPFRSDKKFFFSRGRVREIQKSLELYTFNCHKTVDYDDCKPVSYQESHCAGALILLEKTGRPSLLMRLAQKFGWYDPTKLDMKASVYESFEEMAQSTED